MTKFRVIIHKQLKKVVQAFPHSPDMSLYEGDDIHAVYVIEAETCHIASCLAMANFFAERAEEAKKELTGIVVTSSGTDTSKIMILFGRGGSLQDDISLTRDEAVDLVIKLQDYLRDICCIRIKR